jgi:hypothetical protein
MPNLLNKKTKPKIDLITYIQTRLSWEKNLTVFGCFRSDVRVYKFEDWLFLLKHKMKWSRDKTRLARPQNLIFGQCVLLNYTFSKRFSFLFVEKSKCKESFFLELQ